MNEKVRYGHEGLKEWFKEGCFINWVKARSKGVAYH